MINHSIELIHNQKATTSKCLYNKLNIKEKPNILLNYLLDILYIPNQIKKNKKTLVFMVTYNECF